MAFRMLKLYRKMGPMAGGTRWYRGTSVLRSPIYQGMPVKKPISDFLCPSAGIARTRKNTMMISRTERSTPFGLPVIFPEYRASFSIVPYFVDRFNTCQII